MKIIPDVKATFGDLYFLGYTEKMKYDRVTGRRTEELEGYVCRLASSELRGQVEVTVPADVSVDLIGFNQKVMLQGVEIDPYARSSEGSSFAEVVMRCTARTILDASKPPMGNKEEGKKTA